MGTYVIKMPDIGEGIAEVELVHWYVKPGDVVAEEQILADVMTDKANVEIPSNVAGKVLSLSGKPGDVIAVGAEIIRLEVEGKGNVKEGAPDTSLPRRREPNLEAVPKPEPKPAPALRSVPPATSSPRPLQRSDGPGPNLPESSDRPLAAPAVRRRARELGIDIAAVRGSGADGRVT